MGIKRIKYLNELKDFKKKVSRRYKIDKLILFGSRAKGKSSEKSDFDILLVSPNFKRIKWRERQISLYPLWDFNKFDHGADFLCYTPEEFEKLKNKICIVRTAAKEGIEIN